MAESATVGELLVRIRADVSDLERGLGQAQTGIANMASRGTPGIRTITSGLRALAFQAAGIPGPIGRISTALLSLGIGGVATLGVIAGIAAITLAWRALTKEARESAKAQEEAIKAGLQTPLKDAQKQAIVAEAAFKAAIQARDKVQARREVIPEFAIQPGKQFPEGIRNFAWVQLNSQLADANIKVQNARAAFIAWDDKVRELQDDLKGASREAKNLAIIFPTLVGFPKTYKPLGELAPDVTKIGKLVDVPTISIAAATASDRFMERWRADVRQKYDEMRLVGESIGQALATGINDVLQGGNFLKGFFRTLLNVAVNVATTLAGRAIGNALFPGAGVAAGALSGGGGASGFFGKVAAPTGMLDFSTFPAPTNPLAAARDAQWQAFFRETGLVARKMGYR